MQDLEASVVDDVWSPFPRSMMQIDSAVQILDLKNVEKMAKSNVSGGWEVFKGGVSPHDSHSAQRRARP